MNSYHSSAPPRSAARPSSRIGVYSAEVQERATNAYRDHVAYRALSTPEFERDLEQALQAAFGKR